MSLALVIATVASLLTGVFAVTPIEVRGRDFVNPITNARFSILGITYQPGGQSGYDPESGKDTLSDGTSCLRDAALMQKLGINTIRVYNLNPMLNHDDCVSIFNGVGIYVIVDVNSPLSGESLDRSDPSGSYTTGYLSRVFAVVEAFKDYPNTLAFFAANEVIDTISTAKLNPPYMRAIQRDLKNYIAKHSPRPIPVGYAAVHVKEVLEDTWSYLQCVIDGDLSDQSRSDFFGLNSYSWCGGDATFETSDYKSLVEIFSNSSIPVFLSEYGCNLVLPRVFDEVQAIYGPKMKALSGGLVYEYSQEPSNYGLVTINDDSTVSLRVDFDNLQAQFKQLDAAVVESIDSTSLLTPPPCSNASIEHSEFSKDFEIPNPPKGVPELIEKGIKNPPRGMIVEVKETEVPVAIYDSKGNEVKGLSITLLPDDQSNRPGSEQITGSSTSSSPPAATTSKKATAAHFETNSVKILFAVVCMLLTTLL